MLGDGLQTASTTRPWTALRPRDRLVHNRRGTVAAILLANVERALPPVRKQSEPAHPRGREPWDAPDASRREVQTRSVIRSPAPHSVMTTAAAAADLNPSCPSNLPTVVVLIGALAFTLVLATFIFGMTQQQEYLRLARQQTMAPTTAWLPSARVNVFRYDNSSDAKMRSSNVTGDDVRDTEVTTVIITLKDEELEDGEDDRAEE
ncbi:hypothetical protein MTO96_030107 [Rhipicephalus appendiculatus]